MENWAFWDTDTFNLFDLIIQHLLVFKGMTELPHTKLKSWFGITIRPTDLIYILWGKPGYLELNNGITPRI